MKMTLKWLTLGVIAALIGGFAFGEWRAWPWLAEPLQRQLSERLGREVRLRALSGTQGQALRLKLWGGIRLEVGQLLIAGPYWRPETLTLSAESVELRLRYRDLWDWRGAGTLRVQALQARELSLDLWRDEQGRATWALLPASTAPSTPSARPPPPLITFDRLALDGGRIALNDRLLQVNARIDFALGQQDGRYSSLVAAAHGRYRGKPLQAWLDSGSPLPWIQGPIEPVPLRLQLKAGAAALDFEGVLRELSGLQGLDGRYRLSGPSLAAIGDPLGVTLPTTAAFQVEGQLNHAGTRWQTEIERALLGRSRLLGSFSYETAGPRPKLSGRLGGASLWFADLGPTVGVPAAADPAPVNARAGKVLPDRQFDLPSLRAMDADVQVALDRIDLGSAFAEPIVPASAQLLLQDGVLSLRQLDARTARGRLGGDITLDGRATLALWTADLNWSGVSLERWIKQTRTRGQPPYLSGELGGRLQLKGQGRSTAELLASAQGRALAYLPRGAISHLALEAAGIDLAQGLGLWVSGDNALPLQCAVADLSVNKGELRPRALVIDTQDSTLWIDGRLSLVSEALDLRLQVAPKDFSPLSLRTPVRIAGNLGAPQISLEAKPLLKRLVPAALLATLNPLAAVLPLIDTGNTASDRAMLQSCGRLLHQIRGAEKPSGKTPKKAPAQPRV